MDQRRKDYALLCYMITLMIILITEIFFDVSWRSVIAEIISYSLFYIIAITACISIKKNELSLGFMIYVILIVSLILSMNLWIFITGIVLFATSFKNVHIVTRIIGSIIITLGIINALLFGIIRNEFIDESTIGEEVSPNGRYTVEQVFIDMGATGYSIETNIRRDIIGVIDISYNLQHSKSESEVNWIDNSSFSIDGKTMKVRF